MDDYKKATIEILKNDDSVLGSSKTNGKYLVREYVDGVEMGGGFHESLYDAERHVENYQNPFIDEF